MHQVHAFFVFQKPFKFVIKANNHSRHEKKQTWPYRQNRPHH